MRIATSIHLGQEADVRTGSFGPGSQRGFRDTIQLDRLEGASVSIHLGMTTQEVYVNATKLRIALADIVSSIEDINGEPLSLLESLRAKGDRMMPLPRVIELKPEDASAVVAALRERGVL